MPFNFRLICHVTRATSCTFLLEVHDAHPQTEEKCLSVSHPAFPEIICLQNLPHALYFFMELACGTADVM